MKTTIIAGRLALACGAVLLGLGGGGVARATECGDLVTSSLKLEKDLTCETSGLVIGADDVTIDLGGHTIASVPGAPGDVAWSGVKTEHTMTLRNVRVMNGTIVGFRWGVAIRHGTAGAAIQNLAFADQADASVFVRDSSGVRITNVKVTDSGPISILNAGDVRISMAAIALASRSPAIIARNSAGVSIRTLAASGPIPSYYGDVVEPDSGILFERVTNADVQGVYVRGFKDGVGFTCPGCAPGDVPNSGSVRDSVFTDDQAGVNVEYASNVTVAGNHVARAGRWHPVYWFVGGGITAAECTGLAVVDNAVSDSLQGLGFMDVTASRIEGNKVLDNVLSGIGLNIQVGGSFGNTVASNIVLGTSTGFDIWAASGPNTWKGNLCRTASGEGVACAIVVP
ncbi:right-handed parallel beta-helix repeat-containing protein [Anaeromyxobacter dehalogenans]|uniref:Parallel beta-helix repeat protein n=1 Tax=Anaeromyxobacter dehalogenans (strain 2CP-C) TaxID=290397 RepID=Q2INE6_ANADE|nr:right-handed parallel beta-helix repeat-containing protein [Anaeromyxobacter dehalogenans]ABC80329.1 Parallel beta-helix repeat protein [Anaeromyxobacter dehalogenans 2CP-C]